MAHRVVWSARALADVEAIASYIATDSPAYATAVVRRIVGLANSLSEFPRATAETTYCSSHEDLEEWPSGWSAT